MLKIAICDDEMQTCHYIENILLEYGKLHGIRIECDIFFSGKGLVQKMVSSNHYDLFFLDIDMPEFNGIDVSRYIRKELKNIESEIIYVSCTTQYDRMLFDFHPLSFISKPFDQKDLTQAVELALRRKQLRKPSYTFEQNRETYVVPFQKILYFEADGRKVSIVTDANTFSHYATFSELKKVLPVFFCQIHRSYIINMLQISGYNRSNVIIKGSSIPIGDTYRDGFLESQISLYDKEFML